MSNLDFTNLSHYYTDESILLKTIDQIRKDLQVSDKEIIPEKGSRIFESIVNQVERIIDFLLDQSFEQFLQCMYRIDINQNQLEKCKINGNYDSKLIAETVVKRCLQKVVIKEWYKKNS